MYVCIAIKVHKVKIVKINVGPTKPPPCAQHPQPTPSPGLAPRILRGLEYGQLSQRSTGSDGTQVWACISIQKENVHLNFKTYWIQCILDTALGTKPTAELSWGYRLDAGLRWGHRDGRHIHTRQRARIPFSWTPSVLNGEPEPHRFPGQSFTHSNFRIPKCENMATA